MRIGTSQVPVALFWAQAAKMAREAENSPGVCGMWMLQCREAVLAPFQEVVRAGYTHGGRMAGEGSRQLSPASHSSGVIWMVPEAHQKYTQQCINK